jgi:protein TonB
MEKSFLFLTILIAGFAGFSQSAKKQNIILKNELAVAKTRYASDVAVYLAEFNELEKARQDYRSYSKHAFITRQNSLNKEISDLRKLMDFCEAFNIDYTKLISEQNLKNAEAFNYKINAERERIMLAEILLFQNVKDTLVVDGLKRKAQNMLLKEQLTIYTTAQNQNAVVLLKQRNIIAEVKKSAKELDSMEVVYYRSVLELDKSLKKLRAYTDQLYEKECKDNKGSTAFTLRYETEFLTKPAPVVELIKPTHKSPFESEIAEVPAEFPGGSEALKKFMTDHIQLPKAVTELGAEGKCYVQFVVKSTGEISDVLVVKGIVECPDCSLEASRLVKEMPHWIPGKTAGKEVSSRVVIPIDFKLK